MRTARVPAWLFIITSLPLFACGQIVSNNEVDRIAGLRGTPQRQALRKFLAEDSLDTSVNRLFYREAQLRPALRSLVDDPKFGNRAFWLLALIGDPADLPFLLRQGSTVDPQSSEDSWAYPVACSLLEPVNEEEWAFLRRCARDDYKDGWVDYGALQTLKLIASKRSRKILAEAASINTHRAEYIAKAIAYIDSNPRPLADRDLTGLAERVADTARIGEWNGNAPPVFNQAGNKALVYLTFEDGRDTFTYGATFHKVGDLWKLRGLRETMQSVGPAPPPPSPNPR